MTSPQDWGFLLLRITLGVVFVMHGYLALAVEGPEATASLITRLGYVPARAALAAAWYLILTHLVGGLMLVVGLWTSLAALAHVPIMAAAVFLLHWPQGFFMRPVVDSVSGRAGAGGYEYPLLVLMATLAVALGGSGPWSLDVWRRRRAFSLP